MMHKYLLMFVKTLEMIWKILMYASKNKEDVNKNRKPDNSYSSEKTINVSEEIASNFEKPAAKKPILKSKNKSFARIPVHFHDFHNVRLNQSIRLNFDFMRHI